MAVMTAAMGGAPSSEACTRIVYKGTDSLNIVGRSLDWKTPIPTNIYVYPRGMKKVGNTLPNSVAWTSKYGSVYAVGYDGGVTEGMNEKGLCINGLFCKGAVYDNDSTKNLPPISMSMFVAWLLDMNATTDEAVATLRNSLYSISGSTFDGGTVTALHWGITDATGKTAILEFDHGAVKIYEGNDIRVLTNDPAWPKMQAINEYWQQVGGRNMLPGTVRSADRYARADYFVRHVEAVGDADLGVSICKSALVTECVPYTYTVEDEPNVSSTQWVSFANLRDKRYYLHLVTDNGFYYIDLNKCDLRPGAQVMKLVTKDAGNLLGEANKHLKKSKPFTPIY